MLHLPNEANAIYNDEFGTTYTRVRREVNKWVSILITIPDSWLVEENENVLIYNNPQNNNKISVYLSQD
tara:strand:- start:554 stop:760 length:207 start_codon:yes stop_codon:yes gene_type:complete